MAERALQHVSSAFRQTLADCRAFAMEANQWLSKGPHPRISRKRRDSIAELVFLRAFLSWEIFLEDSFVLYLLGNKAPKGRALHRYTFPPNKRLAEEWLVPEDRAYAKWDATSVVKRAERFFRDGRPYSDPLRGSQSLLSETRTIRNAIAHESKSAHEKFQNIARVRLGTLPANLTVGRFLSITMVGISPPQSFLEFYLEKLEFISQQVIPGT